MMIDPRKIILIALCVVLSLAAKAQVSDRVQLSIGPDAGVVSGRLSKSHSAMLGGAIAVAVPLNKKLYFTAASGYNYYFGKSNLNQQLQDEPLVDFLGIKSVPAKLGLKYYLKHNIYLQGETGAVFFSGTPQTFYEAGTAFVYAPQIGIDFPLGGHNFFNASLRYESTLPKANNAVKVSFFGLHLGLGF